MKNSILETLSTCAIRLHVPGYIVSWLLTCLFAIHSSEAMQENTHSLYGSHALSEWSTSYVVHCGKSIAIASCFEKLIENILWILLTLYCSIVRIFFFKYIHLLPFCFLKMK